MPKTPPRTGVVTATTGTGAYALGAALTQDGDTLFTFSQAYTNGWITDGATVYYTCKNASGGFEEGIGTYNHGAQTLTRTTILKSSSGGAAVTWGAGDKSLFASFPSDQIMLAANNGSEFSNKPLTRQNLGSTTVGDALFIAASAAGARTTLGSTTVGDALFITASASAARTTLGLGTAATLNVGTSANNVVQLNGSAQLPAVSGALLTNLPSSAFPATTPLLFGAAPPTGWTRVNETEPFMPMIAQSGDTPGAAGGSWTVSDLSTTGTSGSTALTESQIPSHEHVITAYFPGSGSSTGIAYTNTGGNVTSLLGTESTGSGSGHTHPVDIVITSGGAWRPRYKIWVKATKD